MVVELSPKTQDGNGKWAKVLSDFGKVIDGDGYFAGTAEEKLYRIISSHPFNNDEQQGEHNHVFIIDSDPNALSIAGNKLLEQGKVTQSDLERITAFKPGADTFSSIRDEQTGMRVIHAPNSILAFRFPTHPTPAS